MTINSLSGNFQLTSQDFSGNSVPEKNKVVTLKPAVIAPISERQIDGSITTETSETSAKKIVADLNERVEQIEIDDSTANNVSFRQNIQRSLRFRVDDITGGTIISVIDRQTDETIRQIPSEEVLVLSRRFAEINQQISSAVGVLFSSDV